MYFGVSGPVCFVGATMGGRGTATFFPQSSTRKRNLNHEHPDDLLDD